MKLPTRALSLAEIRSIIRAHPTLFSAMGGAYAENATDLSVTITKLLFANPAIVDAVTAAGMDIDGDVAPKLGLFKWLAAVAIIQQTLAAHGAETLTRALFEEMAPLCFPSGALQ